MNKHGERVRVRGACAAGHVTETTAEKRRVTRTLQCSNPECELEVLCKRISSTEPVPEGGKPQTLPSGAKVRRVASYERAEREPAGAGVDEESGGGALRDDAGNEVPVAEPHEELRAAPAEPGFVGGARRDPPPARDELVPGIF